MPPEERQVEFELDPRESAYVLPPVDRRPFADAREKSRAIRRMIEQAERERGDAP